MKYYMNKEFDQRLIDKGLVDQETLNEVINGDMEDVEFYEKLYDEIEAETLEQIKNGTFVTKGARAKKLADSILEADKKKKKLKEWYDMLFDSKGNVKQGVTLEHLNTAKAALDKYLVTLKEGEKEWDDIAKEWANHRKQVVELHKEMDAFEEKSGIKWPRILRNLFSVD